MFRLLPMGFGFASQPTAKNARRQSRASRTQYLLRLEVLEDRTLPAIVFWTNPSGGDWADAANWDTGALPGSLDDVVIDVPGNVTVTHLSGTHVVQSLASFESILFLGGS